jgi:bifunctional UDP-N-acetylglucosamine pyrophosphorylase/glucosamine-1-phosphate N-acetyltransferase
MRIKQAVILAAGMSTRTYPLTLNRPKALLKLLNLENIFYLLEGLNNAQYEKAVIVVHFKKELIENLIGNQYKNLKIDYAFQEQPLGTGHAVLCAMDYLNPEPFLILNSDDFILPSVFNQEINHIPSLLISHHEQAYRFGVVELNDKEVTKIIEKDPQAAPFSPVNTGAWFLPYETFNWLKEIKPAEDGEIRLTDIVPYLMAMKVEAIDIGDNWIPMSYPWDLLLINQKLLNNFCLQKENLPWFLKHLEDNSLNTLITTSSKTIISPVVIGKGSVVDESATIKNSVLGKNCQLQKGVQVINSVIGDNVIIKEGSIIKDSVIMDDVIIGSKVTVINTNNDGSNIVSLVKGKMVDTGLKELGSMIAEKVMIEDSVTLMPGVKIWPNKTISQGTVVSEDILD